MKNLLGKKVINNQNCFDASVDKNDLCESGNKSQTRIQRKFKDKEISRYRKRILEAEKTNFSYSQYESENNTATYNCR